MPETVLESMRAAITADVTLPSGRVVTGTLPRIRDCLIAGDIPLPVLVEMERLAKNPNGDGLEPSPEQLHVVADFNDNLVLAFVVAIDGEPVMLAKDDLRLFDEDDFNAMVLYASRATPLPGKE
jgi:hypothetical protein